MAVFSPTGSGLYSRELLLFTFAASLCLFAVILGLFLENILIVLGPIAIIGSVLMCLYPEASFIGFFAVLPFSIEVYFANGLGTDMPTEPIILFFFCWSLFVFFREKTKSGEKKKGSVAVLSFLVLHLFWIFFSSLFAVHPEVSFKFLLAKLWYVLPFFCLSQEFLKTKNDYRTWLHAFFIGMMISVGYVMLRHAGMGFAFDKIGSAGSPFYRNHVNYAALLTISLPFAWFMSRQSAYKKLYRVVVVTLLVAVYLSFTRAAMFTVVLLFVAAILVRFRMLFISSIVAICIAIGSVFFLAHENNYLHYAPNFESTVAHTKFDNLVEATYKMEDISTMERLHRWIAGAKMVQERPWTGFGPNNFTFTYKPYTNNSFQTYVSDNPDKSGVHNYFLMVAIEQGFLGLFFFICFLLALIYSAEKGLSRMVAGFEKDLLLTALLVVVGITAFNLINDLFEAVKVGVFFFVAAGIIYKMSKGTNLVSS